MMSAEEPPGLREKDLLPGRMMRDCMRCRAASASAACAEGVGGGGGATALARVLQERRQALAAHWRKCTC